MNDVFSTISYDEYTCIKNRMNISHQKTPKSCRKMKTNSNKP